MELITPIAMDKELRFAIREGGRTVGCRRRRRDHRVERAAAVAPGAPADCTGA